MSDEIGGRSSIFNRQSLGSGPSVVRYLMMVYVEGVVDRRPGDVKSEVKEGRSAATFP
jgi:hypothetical protein